MTSHRGAARQQRGTSRSFRGLDFNAATAAGAHSAHQRYPPQPLKTAGGRGSKLRAAHRRHPNQRPPALQVAAAAAAPAPHPPRRPSGWACRSERQPGKAWEASSVGRRQERRRRNANGSGERSGGLNVSYDRARHAHTLDRDTARPAAQTSRKTAQVLTVAIANPRCCLITCDRCYVCRDALHRLRCSRERKSRRWGRLQACSALIVILQYARNIIGRLRGSASCVVCMGAALAPNLQNQRRLALVVSSVHWKLHLLP